MSIKDAIDSKIMCLSFCYAGRNGNCSAAGSDNNQVMNCLSQYRREQSSGVV